MNKTLAQALGILLAAVVGMILVGLIVSQLPMIPIYML